MSAKPSGSSTKKAIKCVVVGDDGTGRTTFCTFVILAG